VNVLQAILMLALLVAFASCAKRLLKTPKIYNALITTDDELMPSRAFPVIQPVLQPAFPVLSPFYPGTYFDPYNPYPNQVNHEHKVSAIRGSVR